MDQQKQKKWFRQWFFMLVGGILGAWFLTLPKAVLDVWIVPGVVIITALGIVMILFHLIIAEISLSLPTEKTLFGIIHTTLPKPIAYSASILLIIYFFLCFIAYISLGSWFLSLLLHELHMYINPAWSSLLFVWVVWYLQRRKTKQLHETNTVIWLFLLAAIGAILLAGLFWENNITTAVTDRDNWHNAYGIAFLAMNGMITIPMLYKATERSAIHMRSVILTSGFVVTLVCLFFCLAVLAISWANTTFDSIHGIAAVRPILGIIGSMVWLFAMISCYTSIGVHVQEILQNDFSLPATDSLLLTILIPFIFFLYFNPNILNMLGIAWGIIGSLLIILIVCVNILLHITWQKMKIVDMLKGDQIRSRILIWMCIIGIIAQIIAL